MVIFVQSTLAQVTFVHIRYISARYISMYVNIEGFLTYRCISTRFHDGVVLMMPFCLMFQKMGQNGGTKIPKKRPKNGWNSQKIGGNASKNGLKWVNMTAILRVFWRIDVYRQTLFLGFTMPLLRWPKLGWGKHVMCSRGQILLEIPNANAMVTQNWVGK